MNLSNLTHEQLSYLYKHGDSELRSIVTAEMSARQQSMNIRHLRETSEMQKLNHYKRYERTT